MDNPFIKAQPVTKRLKLLMYGAPGSGKTITALQFPRPVVIDLERGTELYGKDFQFDVLNANTPEEVEAGIKFLIENKHDYRTLVVDPYTILWQSLQAKWNDIFLKRRAGGKGFKHEFYEMQPRDWGTLKSEDREICRMLARVDMSVVVTCHQKDLYAEGELMKKVGVTYDGPKGLDYFFDTVVRMWRTPQGKFMGIAEKDRNNILPVGEFPMSYTYFAERLGVEMLERKATPVLPASPQQLEQLESWFVLYRMDDRKVKKMLSRYDIAEKDEITEPAAADMITQFEVAYDKQQGGADAEAAQMHLSSIGKESA
jgi:hypothetical protein